MKLLTLFYTYYKLFVDFWALKPDKLVIFWRLAADAGKSEHKMSITKTSETSCDIFE